MGLSYLASGIFFLLCCAVFASEIFVHRKRQVGRYPVKGSVTLEDVRTLAQEGEHTLAIRAYREVTGASLKEAKAFVEVIEMERQ